VSNCDQAFRRKLFILYVRNSKTGNPGEQSLTHQTEFLTEVGTLSDHFTRLPLEWRAAQILLILLVAYLLGVFH